MDLKDRRVLVSGATSGIGRALTQRLLGMGCRVVGIGRDFSGFQNPPEGFTPLEIDLSELETLPARFDRLARSSAPVDAVVFNAGYGRFGSLEEFSPEQILRLVHVNLVSHIFLARSFLPHLKGRGSGDLIFIGSDAALSGGRKGAVYSATKFALRGLAQSLRLECSGAGVRVSIVNPGMVQSPFYDHLDFAPGQARENALAPSDVADAVAMVLSAPPGTVYDEINLSPLKKVIQFRAREDRSGKP